MLNKNFAGTIIFGILFLLCLFYGFLVNWSSSIIIGTVLSALITFAYAKRIKYKI